MLNPWQLPVLLLCVSTNIPAATSAFYYQTWYLENACGRRTSLSTDGFGVFRASVFSDLLPSNCTATYYLPSFEFPDWPVSKLYLDLESISYCQTSYSHTQNLLQLYDGGSLSSPRLASINLSDTSSVDRYSGSALTTSSRYLTFHVLSDNHLCYPTFRFRFTAFYHSDNCFVRPGDNEQYHCSNDRCINTDLTCDGFDNCANDDDERGTKCYDAALIAGITFAAIVGALLLICLCCICCAGLCRHLTPTTESHIRSVSSSPSLNGGRVARGRVETPPYYPRAFPATSPPSYEVAISSSSSSSPPRDIQTPVSDRDNSDRDKPDHSPPPSYRAAHVVVERSASRSGSIEDDSTWHEDTRQLI